MTAPTITVVIAQCLQRSFISPLAGPDPRLKPCHLHAGYANTVRLLGGGPQSLPNVLEDFLWHAHGGADGQLAIRDATIRSRTVVLSYIV